MTFDEMQLIMQSVIISQREFQTEMVELKALAQSNGRAIQSMLDQAATDRLRREEEKAEHQVRIERLEANMERLEANAEILTNTQRGIATLLGSLDEDRPTILRKLNSIENQVAKIDTIIDRLTS